MEAAALIVPGTGLSPQEKSSCFVFHSKNTEHIKKPTDKNRKTAEQDVKRLEKDSHAIDKKHKDRGISSAGGFPPPECLQGSKQYF